MSTDNTDTNIFDQRQSNPNLQQVDNLPKATIQSVVLDNPYRSITDTLLKNSQPEKSNDLPLEELIKVDEESIKEFYRSEYSYSVVPLDCGSELVESGVRIRKGFRIAHILTSTDEQYSIHLKKMLKQKQLPIQTTPVTTLSIPNKTCFRRQSSSNSTLDDFISHSCIRTTSLIKTKGPTPAIVSCCAFELDNFGVCFNPPESLHAFSERHRRGINRHEHGDIPYSRSPVSRTPLAGALVRSPQRTSKKPLSTPGSPSRPFHAYNTRLANTEAEVMAMSNPMDEGLGGRPVARRPIPSFSATAAAARTDGYYHQMLSTTSSNNNGDGIHQEKNQNQQSINQNTKKQQKMLALPRPSKIHSRCYTRCSPKMRQATATMKTILLAHEGSSLVPTKLPASRAKSYRPSILLWSHQDIHVSSWWSDIQQSSNRIGFTPATPLVSMEEPSCWHRDEAHQRELQKQRELQRRKEQREEQKSLRLRLQQQKRQRKMILKHLRELIKERQMDPLEMMLLSLRKGKRSSATNPSSTEGDSVSVDQRDQSGTVTSQLNTGILSSSPSSQHQQPLQPSQSVYQYQQVHQEGENEEVRAVPTLTQEEIERQWTEKCAAVPDYLRANETEIDSLNALSQPESSSISPHAIPFTTTHCHCKKTRCLKLYCECFATNSYCKDCDCQSCMNTPEHFYFRQEARALILEKNPTAFKSSIGFEPGTGQPTVIRSCSCKKNNCLKGYCECFLAGVDCGENCHCVECKNRDGSPEQSLARERMKKRKKHDV